MSGSWKALLRKTILQRHFGEEFRDSHNVTEEDFLLLTKDLVDPLLESYKSYPLNEGIDLSKTTTALRSIAAISQQKQSLGDFENTEKDIQKPTQVKLYIGQGFEIIGNNDGQQIHPTNISFIILPYTLDKSGMLHRIGVEYKEAKKSATLLTDILDPNTPDVLTKAIELLKDKVGANVDDVDKWDYLGILKIDSILQDSLPCFAVNVTKLIDAGTYTTGFNLIQMAEAVESDNVFILSAFLKLFKHFYKKDNI